MGRYLFLTDDSGIGNDHEEPRVPCYRVERLDGRVGEVNLRQGYFTVEQGRERVAVRIPNGLDRNELRKVERLRRGDRVDVDVRTISGDEAELVRVR